MAEEDQHVIRTRRLREAIERARRPAGAGESSEHDGARHPDHYGQDHYLTPPPRQARASTHPGRAHRAIQPHREHDAKEAGTHLEVVLAHGPPRHSYTVNLRATADRRFRRA